MADYEYINATGVIVPDVASILAQVQSEFLAAFGNDLDLTPSTPQGLLISTETLARAVFLRNNAALANQINPNLAGGIFLDAIMALTGSERVPATFSTVTVNLTGVAGITIPAGAQMRSAAGDLFENVTNVTLDINGEATSTFRSLIAGPISANAGTLTQIVTVILGWETGVNPTDAILGSEQQTDQQAKLFRRNTLALQGMALSEAIISALVATPGVRGKPVFRQNDTDNTVVIDGITLLPHSIYVCVDGGTGTDVANTLYYKKSPGCNYNGSTNVTLIDQYSGQNAVVKFDRPTQVPILVRATVSVSSATINPVSATRKAILDYANGLIPFEDGFIVGASVSPFELAGAVNQEAPGVYVQKVEVSKLSPVNYVTVEIPLQIFEQANVQEGSISVIVI